MDTVVNTLWNVKHQSFVKPKILPYRMNRNCAKQTSELITIKLSSLYIMDLINVIAYRAPATPIGPHSFPPDRWQWWLYRSTLRCRPTAAPRSAGQPLSATRNTVTCVCMFSKLNVKNILTQHKIFQMPIWNNKGQTILELKLDIWCYIWILTNSKCPCFKFLITTQ